MHSVRNARLRALSRRELLIGAGLGMVGCGGGKGRGLPACASQADGPGLGFCLVGVERLTVPGGASLSEGRAMIMAADDNNAAIVARDALGFYALSATCRHQCCTVTLCDGTCGQPIVSPNECAPARSAQLVPNGPAFLCPCHGSTYGADGRVLTGPSLQSLSALAMEIIGPDVIVDLSRAANPGDRVTG
jgi:nitrite reductase/ring-hydroxylating ferredoxin subunit